MSEPLDALWNVLLAVGFRRQSRIDLELGRFYAQQTGFNLPNVFLEFLCFSPPAEFDLTFRYIDDRDGREWIGQFAEVRFRSPPLCKNLVLETIRTDWDACYLTFGSSSGGADNLYLELNKTGMPVVVIDDLNLRPMQAAENFEAFLRQLAPRPEDER